jgi:endoglucanase
MLKKISVLVFVAMMSGGMSFSEEQTPVEKYGLLKVKGTQIVDKAGNPVQLKGVSLFWSQWGFMFWNEEAISYIVKNWNVTVIRAAMGVAKGGYLEHKEEKELVKKAVDIAVKNGIYVIIDWHDHEASYHAKEAEAFFREMARLYKDTPNVMFEPYNEPLVNESWESVKKYSERIIKIIRKEGAQNIVLVGSPSWSRDVDSAALDPIKKYKNVAYTLHFYAGSHREDIREKAEFAMKRGLALFVTEWGTSIDTGDGGYDPEESDLWIQFMDKYKISWCNWSLIDKPETTSILKPGASKTGGWTDNDLTESGKYIRDKLLQPSNK